MVVWLAAFVPSFGFSSRSFLDDRSSIATISPWAFFTGLPPSNGNTIVLSLVDRFSKVLHVVPLSKLPSVKETAQLLLLEIFDLHGLTVAVVSYWGAELECLGPLLLLPPVISPFRCAYGHSPLFSPL